MELIAFLLIGALAGWIAGEVMRGDGFGLIGNMLLGIIGAFLGGYLFGLLGFEAYGFIGSLITSTVGAILVLWVASFFSSSRQVT